MSNDKQQSHRSSARPWVVVTQSRTFRLARLQHKERESNGTYRAELQRSMTDLKTTDTFPARQVIFAG
jgi:hypothetical protein